jgi:hypothetical protein
MFRIVNKLTHDNASSARRDGATRRSRRARIGLESLEDRRVPAALLASAAVAAHVPPGPVMPALAAHFPPGPV